MFRGNLVLLCFFIAQLGVGILAYEPTDGYDKCLTDQDCANKTATCAEGEASVCDVSMEECSECSAVQYHPKPFPFGSACEFVSCQNGGTCEVKGDDFRCKCAPGWEGAFCQDETPALDKCRYVDCQNAAVCEWHPLDADHENGFICACPPGYYGLFCQKDMCDDISCHNGVCERNAPGGVACRCDEGWEGDRCDEPVLDNCQWVSCQNEAVCESHASNADHENGFVCLCPPGFSGTFCQEDMCASKDCNIAIGGRCEAGACVCPPGWAGEACQFYMGVTEPPRAPGGYGTMAPGGAGEEVCTLDSDCTQECGEGKEPFCSVPYFACECKNMTVLPCTTHHDCSAACDGVLGLCMRSGLCDCFHGLPNYIVHMIVNKFPDSPPYSNPSVQLVKKTKTPSADCGYYSRPCN